MSFHKQVQLMNLFGMMGGSEGPSDFTWKSRVRSGRWAWDSLNPADLSKGLSLDYNEKDPCRGSWRREARRKAVSLCSHANTDQA